MDPSWEDPERRSKRIRVRRASPGLPVGVVSRRFSAGSPHIFRCWGWFKALRPLAASSRPARSKWCRQDHPRRLNREVPAGRARRRDFGTTLAVGCGAWSTAGVVASSAGRSQCSASILTGGRRHPQCGGPTGPERRTPLLEAAPTQRTCQRCRSLAKSRGPASHRFRSLSARSSETGWHRPLRRARPCIWASGP